MKVICVDASDHDKASAGHDSFNLVEGNVYHVINSGRGLYDCGDTVDVYELMEDPNWGYERWRFIPLSNIDEMELLEQRQNELVEVNTNN